MTDEVLIRIEGVSKKFCRTLKRSLWYGVQDTFYDLIGYDNSEQGLRRNEFWAVNDVSFGVRRGECLGLIGRNGAGKTTLLKMLNGLIKPDRGRIEMRGRVGALIALGAGFNPILTGRENIYVNGAVLGLSKKEIDAKYNEIVEFAEIGEFIDAPVQSYSSGMQVRLGFAIATALHPDVLLLDEVLSVGDSNFQAKCYDRIGTVLDTAAVILVSHNPYHIQKICDRVILLNKGERFAAGTPDEVLRTYQRMDLPSPNKRLIILGEGVNYAEIKCATTALVAGDVLELRLELSLVKAIQCDKAYINIIDQAGMVHAQIIVNDLVGKCLRPGSSIVTFRIGPLYLSNGSFEGHIVLWTSGGKKTMVQMRHVFAFDYVGPVSLGAAVYYPPAQVTVAHHDNTSVGETVRP